MAKKKGRDAEKKAALQAKKEAKADKTVRKRLQKEAKSVVDGKGDAREEYDAVAAFQREQQEEAAALDALLQHYRQKDSDDKSKTSSYMEVMDGFPLPRANASFTLYEDTKKKNAEAYLFGGEYYDGVENIVVDHLFKYDFSKNEWKRIHTHPQTPPARCAHSCVYYNHALYVFGGELATADEYYHYKDLWRYDIKTMMWEEIKTASSSKKSAAAGSAPSARSGHSAVVWKHYMVIFGGFYEALRDTPRWFNDVTVLDLQTLQWLDIPHSKLAARPEPRSACNAALMGDDRLMLHGGFSKIPKSSIPLSKDASSSTSINSPETKVHTDSWILHLKPLLQGKPPTWERWTSSIQRTAHQLSASRTPNGRCGCSTVALSGSKKNSNRVLVYGGVVDKELHHHMLESIFYNDLNAFDLERKKWFPIHVKKQGKATGEEASGNRRRRRRKGAAAESEEDGDDGNDDSEDDEEEKAQNDDDEDIDLEEVEGDENEPDNTGWDLGKLRSNMFAFLDGNGNIVYEKIEDDDDDPANLAQKEQGGSRRIDDDSDGDEKKDEEKEEEKDDESEEEKEEEKEGNTVMEDSKTEEKDDDDGGDSEEAKEDKTKTSKRTTQVTSSSVMALNANTKAPEAVTRSEPLPRIKANLIINGQILYVYGGLVEVGDREVTLDDFWSIDLKRRDSWNCIYGGSMYKQVWRGAAHDDDDSYYSSKAGDDDNDDEDDDEDESSDDEDTGKSKKSSKQKQSGLREEIAALNEQYDLGDENRTLRSGESLADFYARTSSYWNNKAAEVFQAQTSASGSTNESLSNKELKREGFSLARQRYEELGPVMERLRDLDISTAMPSTDDRVKSDRHKSDKKSDKGEKKNDKSEKKSDKKSEKSEKKSKKSKK